MMGRGIARKIQAGLLLTSATIFFVGCGGGTSDPIFQITTTSLSNGRVDQAYSATLGTSAGSGSISWSISQGALPDGLQLDDVLGKIEGVPTTVGSSQVTILAQDSSTPPKQAAKLYTVSVLAGLVIETSTLPNAVRHTEYEFLLSAQNGDGALTWTLLSGSLPANMGLSSNGRISGSTFNTGDFTFTAKVTDSSSPPQSTQKELTITVAPGLLIQEAFVRGYRLDLPYDSGDSFYADGGIPPYKNWRVVSGTLPVGLALDSISGIISGTPTEEREATITVAVDDSTKPNQTAHEQLVIKPAEPLVVDQVSLDALKYLKLNQDARIYLNASGGTHTYSWAITDGVLPSGLEFRSIPGFSGEIFGAPTETGLFNFTLEVTDNTSPPYVVSSDVQMLADDLLITPVWSLPTGIIQRSYSSQLEVVGGVPPYAWTVSDSSGQQNGLPIGLTVDPVTGLISGTPEEVGSFGLLIRVTDSSMPPLFDEEFSRLTIEDIPSFLAEQLRDGIINQTYQDWIDIQGGLSPFQISLDSGSLPPGITIPTGSVNAYHLLLEGRPTQAGVFGFTLSLQDSSLPPFTATQDFTIRVAEILEITTESLPVAIPEQPYSAQVEATGGIPPYLWRLLSTFHLPNGLSLDPDTGIISGFPVTAETQNFLIDVLDSAIPARSTNKGLSIEVPNPYKITTTRIPDGRVNVFYKVRFAVSDAKSAVWTLVDGSLPSGLTLDETFGLISGTPTQVESATFTIQADAVNSLDVVTQTFTVAFHSSLPRNDGVATATPFSNGTVWASLSPYADPVDVPGPDTDFYEFTAFAGAIVEINASAVHRFSAPGGLDTVVEVVDTNGVRHMTCEDKANDYVVPPIIRDSGGQWDDMCMNDDARSGVLESELRFRVPGEPGAIVTFYVHVLDFRGDARPDFTYILEILGVR